MIDGTVLLLTCLRREADEVKIDHLQGYSEKAWEGVFAAAVKQGVTPILYHALKPICSGLHIPVHTLEAMRNAYLSSAARNLRLYMQLLQTVAFFNSKRVGVILLKGAHLAESAYGNIALRPMSDVDLLVKRDELPRVHELLIEDGYYFTDEKSLSSTKHLAPYHKKDGVCLEIHFHITDPPFSERIDTTTLWERSRVETFQGVEVRVLCPEDLFLHLCLHTGIQHGFENGLISCFDIAYLIERYGGEMDWDVLWNRGREWGIERSVYLMPALTERILGSLMPEQVRRLINSDWEIVDTLAAAEDLILNRDQGTTRYLARLFGEQGWRSKFQYLKQRAFPPGETMYAGEKQLEKRKNLTQYLLYLKRIWVLLRRHGKTVWRGLRGDTVTITALETQNERNKLRDWLTGVKQ